MGGTEQSGAFAVSDENPADRAREFWSRQFKLASTPFAWWLSARRLMRAAGLLWVAFDADLQKWSAQPASARELENLEVGVSCMMLTGFALENAVKGVLLKRRPELAKKGRSPRWPGGGHDLPRLFEEAGVLISEGERDVVQRLAEFVTWRGRYPMPQRMEEMTLVHRPDGSTPMSDYRIAGELFTRLCGLLNIRETAK